MMAFKAAGLARFGIGMRKNQAWAAGEARAPTISAKARCFRDICGLPSQEDDIKLMGYGDRWVQSTSARHDDAQRSRSGAAEARRAEGIGKRSLPTVPWIEGLGLGGSTRLAQ